MKIGIVLAKNEFFYDVHALTKAFYPEADVLLVEEGGTEPADRVLYLSPGDGESVRERKDDVKRRLYHMLQRETGRDLPWGALCGIRPVHLPLAMLEEGLPKAAARERLLRAYLLSEKKADLAIRIAELEKNILDVLPKAEDAFALYVHVPVCPSICAYCSFSSTPLRQAEGQLDAYVDALLSEMDALVKARSKRGQALSPMTVYIGGGTPTVLSEKQLGKLLTGIRKRFPDEQTREFTVEAGRPDSMTAEKLQILKAHAVNRISVNPQTMQEETLARIGRAHTRQDVLDAYALARHAGFDNINMDIIVGLPGETAEDVLDTLAQLTALHPDAITVHTLALKRASQIVKEQKEVLAAGGAVPYDSFKEAAFGNADDVLDEVYAQIEEAGMQAYYLYRQKNMRGALENTGFARPGKECLYNIFTMEERMDIAAVGAGAIAKHVWKDGTITRADAPKEIPLYLHRLDEVIEKKLHLYGEDC